VGEGSGGRDGDGAQRRAVDGVLIPSRHVFSHVKSRLASSASAREVKRSDTRSCGCVGSETAWGGWSGVLVWERERAEKKQVGR
jgi:hypothetical protein